MAKLKLKAPKAFEKFALASSLITLVLTFILANKLFLFGVDYNVNWISGITTKAITLFWIAVIIFHIMLMVLITRSIIIKGTSYIYDYVAGFFAIIGIFLIIASTIAGIYFGHKEITWFFNIKQPIIFVTGYLLEVLTMVYYAITD